MRVSICASSSAEWHEFCKTESPTHTDKNSPKTQCSVLPTQVPTPRVSGDLPRLPFHPLALYPAIKSLPHPPLLSSRSFRMDPNHCFSKPPGIRRLVPAATRLAPAQSVSSRERAAPTRHPSLRQCRECAEGRTALRNDRDGFWSRTSLKTSYPTRLFETLGSHPLGNARVP